MPRTEGPGNGRALAGLIVSSGAEVPGFQAATGEAGWGQRLTVRIEPMQDGQAAAPPV